MDDIRWKQRFDNLQSAYSRLQEAIAANQQSPDNQLIQMALHIAPRSPRSCFFAAE